MLVRPILSSIQPSQFSGSAALLDLADLGITVPECPTWCIDASGHSDADDTPATPVLRHRSKAMLLEPIEVGGNVTRTGRTTATITVQTEQHYDRSRPATINLAIENNSDKTYATLSPAEARTIGRYLLTCAEQAELS